jgi:hypothetical protein
MTDDLVKLIHARDLRQWARFPAYEEHSGKTLGQHKAEVKAREDARRKIWRLVEAKSIVEDAERPKTYLTELLRSPWPISLPGRRSVQLPHPRYPETAFQPEKGHVAGEWLVLPLFMKARQVSVRYLATDRVANGERVAAAEALLERASTAEIEELRTFLAMPDPDPVLFISHRWTSSSHPDPDGKQLDKLKALESCYIIYDYSSFPQDMSRRGAERNLRQVLEAMNTFVDNVVVLADPEYLTRGWCLYEYISASLTHRSVCDEINAPPLVRLRNLVASDPNPPGLGSTYREARNAKSQLLLEAVNTVLPVFGKGAFSVAADREIVQGLLIQRLQRSLPPKQEYMPYVGEWKTIQWTTNELAAAFVNDLQWEALQHDPTFPIFEPVVPNTLSDAVSAKFAIQQQPKSYGKYGLDRLDLSGLGRVVLLVRVGAVAVILLFLWAIYRALVWVWGQHVN